MTATHNVLGIEVPAAGTWRVDPEHTQVGFVARHLGLAKTRGRFTAVDGTVHMAADPVTSTIDITIGMDSIDTGSVARDVSLRSPTYFDVDNHPTAHFHSTAIVTDANRGTVTGDLTLKGVSRSVVLDIDYLGHVQDPWGHDRAAFSATAVINREEWGVAGNMALDSGRLLVSKLIHLEIELELILDQHRSTSADHAVTSSPTPPDVR